MLIKLTTLRYLGNSVGLVTIEVDLRKGFPGFTIVGLPDTTVQEAKERIKSAIINSGLQFPYTYKIVVNLAPTALKKCGSAFDLPIALGILLAATRFQPPNWRSTAILGELSLDGSVVHTQNLAPPLLHAHHHVSAVLLPAANAAQAQLCATPCFGVSHLKQAFLHITSKTTQPPLTQKTADTPNKYPIDFSEIIGHGHAKRALMLAAIGGHHVRFTGPPGTGKTLLSSALPSILPPLSAVEQHEVTSLHALDDPNITTFSTIRPFRSPHHSCTVTGMIGGGAVPKPGEISLAHHGVLFLDEAPEFSRQVLESLRQPLESGTIAIARSQWKATFPAQFTLLLGQNPCPCGYAYDTAKECTCLPHAIARYQQKLSGPLLDRIDLHVPVTRETGTDHTTSAQLQNKVLTAKAILHRIAPLTPTDEQFLKDSCTKLHLSLRAQHRIAAVAKTIAALENKNMITQDHILEALQYRQQ